MKIFDLMGNAKGEKKLPPQFSEQVSEDIVKKAVLAIQANNRQPYGAYPGAGKRVCAKLSRRRRDYKGSYGLGISRVPRKIMSRRGTRFNWVGAFAPGTVKGRRAHPPKSWKVWFKKMNTKERRKAIRSALSAVFSKEIVETRGHMIPPSYPFIVENGLQNLDTTEKVIASLIKLGFEKEIERVKEKKVRAGIGKMRGRKHRTKVGPLLVVGEDCKLIKSGVNIPGVNIVKVNALNAELLAPGCSLGRVTLFTESAIEKMEKEKLFM